MREKAPEMDLGEPAKVAEKLERDLLREGLGYLRSRPDVLWVGRFNSGRVAGIQLHEADTPDTGGYLRWPGSQYPRPFWIEWKTKTGRATPGQIRQLTKHRRDGCLVGIARSVEDAAKILSGVEIEIK